MFEVIITENRKRLGYRYIFEDVYEADDFALFWLAQVYNDDGILLADYSKLPY